MRAELTEGITFLCRHRVLRPLVLTGTVLNVANAGYFAVFVLWAGRELRLITTVWLLGTALLVVPVAVPHVVAIAVTVALVGCTTMVGNVVGQPMRQRLVPNGLLGRVAGASRALAFGSPVGATLGGTVGETLGLPAVLLGAVGLSLVLVVWVARVVPGCAVGDDDDARSPAPDAALASVG